ncbi:MAG: DNA repair protein RecO [Firmicutes bacterium]|nr:DNA repair protein RecO [Bacillota bacterium]
MVTDTEGIVLRQVKAMGGRRMISLFSQKYGKISVGTSINEGGRNKTALSVKAFSYGRYELFKNRDNYNLNNGQVLKSYYGLGEDLDKYMAASYVLELTDKLLPEELPQPRIFNLLVDFLEALEKREKKHGTLVMAYLVKILDILGTMPNLDACALCEREPARDEKGKLAATQFLFSIKEGGMTCPSCAKEITKQDERPLIYKLDIGIIDILKFFQKQPMSAFEKIALDDKLQSKLQEIIKEYISYHLDISGLKSESFF